MLMVQVRIVSQAEPQTKDGEGQGQEVSGVEGAILRSRGWGGFGDTSHGRGRVCTGVGGGREAAPLKRRRKQTEVKVEPGRENHFLFLSLAFLMGKVALAVSVDDYWR